MDGEPNKTKLRTHKRLENLLRKTLPRTKNDLTRHKRQNNNLAIQRSGA